MKTYEQILQEKIAYYGNTEAAREFAAREYYEGWIDVNEYGEPLDTPILVKMKDESIGYAEYHINSINVINGHFGFDMPKVTHWRPIYHD